MLLRMEDLDTERCRKEYIPQLAEDLLWLGLDWDVGWRAGEDAYLQSSRSRHYKEALAILEKKGLLYPCYCSRKERMVGNAPHESDGRVVYSGGCRNLSEEKKTSLESLGRRASVRVRLPEKEVSFTDENYGLHTEQLARDWGDLILRRSDGMYAYQLAVTVDDGEMAISRVVRGADLLSSTGVQIWLHQQLGHDPIHYVHAPLLVDEQGRRLSKRHRDLDVGKLRQWVSAEKLLGFLAYLAGMLETPQAISAKELVSFFSWEKVGQTNIVVGKELLAQWLYE